MRCTFRQFEKMADSHRREIERRGWACVQQLFYSSGLPRRLWRTVLRKRWQGWRTYWKASGPDGRGVFIKVSFGFDWLQPSQAMVEAENEILLYSHFGPHVSDVPKVRMPEVIGHWKTEDAFFSVFSWIDQRTTSLPEVLSHPLLVETLGDLLRKLHAIHPPDGWGAGREPHNFACSRYDDPDHQFASPFDVDFFKNMGLDSAGDLLFFDFEKYQWTRPGLQETVLLQYLQARLSSGGTQMDRRSAACLIGHVPPAERAAAMEQGWRIIEKHGPEWGVSPSCAEIRKQAELLIMQA